MNTSLELNDGRRMPALGLGTWKSEPGEVGAAVREAIRAGYRHIDCAAIYGNEAEIGEGLAAAFADGEVRREDLWVTSKLWNACHLPGDVRPALERTLADLRLDDLDLYLMHWPIAFRPGVGFPRSPADLLPLDEAPLGETWAAMEALVDAGLARSIGVSNFTEARCAEILEGARISPVVNQVELHPVLAQNELLAWSRDHGIVLTAYSPLGSSDRPARIRNEGEPEPLRHPVVLETAERVGATPGQVLIAWALQRGTSVIPKSVNPARIRENFAAAELELDDEAMAALASLDRGERIFNAAFFCPPGSSYSVEWLWS